MVEVMISPKRGRRSRRRQTLDVQEQPLPSLAEALRIVQAAGFLVFSAETEHGWELWSPATPLPLKPRQTLYRYRSDVLTMLHQARACVCCSPRLHRWSWAANEDGIEICLLCRELDESIA